ncbi:NUDIX hydrolase domain-like protein [Powellomyces hirtus]|nr:NUDIX hydrolase domain-like protein [Powellomyces hirtus]
MSTKKILTLVFLFSTDAAGKRLVLLGMKKRGFGVGLWNGFGGKVEPGETIEQGARREVEEESGVHVETLHPAGVLWFEFGTDPMGLECHVFTANAHEGTVVETEEMRPQWWDAEALPFDSMWPDDILWWDYILKRQQFAAAFWFPADQKQILRQAVYAVDVLPTHWHLALKGWA